MHPWHVIPLDESSLEEGFPTVVEIPRGSRNKYEIDKQTGFLRLDRVLHGAVHYPSDYGFVPRTFADDGDPLDVLVLSAESVVPRTIVPARTIGAFRAVDEGAEDIKMLAVSLADPSYAYIETADQLPPHMLRQIERFFVDYKALEGKTMEVGAFEDADWALDCLRRAIRAYRERFGDDDGGS